MKRSQGTLMMLSVQTRVWTGFQAAGSQVTMQVRALPEDLVKRPVKMVFERDSKGCFEANLMVHLRGPQARTEGS